MIMQSPRAALNPTLSSARCSPARSGCTRCRRPSRRPDGAGARRGGAQPDILDRYPHQVSGGQAQRFAIALVAALRADVLIADEPTSALDVTVQSEVIEVLRGLRERHGTAILFISHDLAVISELADEVT